MGAASKLRKMKVMLLKVVTHDELGRPRKLEAVYDEETVDVSDPKNREFITALVEPQVVNPKLKGRA
jgi:hypothetical protein